MSMPRQWLIAIAEFNKPKVETKAQWYTKPKPLFTIDPWELFICLIIGALLSLAIFGG